MLPDTEPRYYTYILRCKDDTLYTGWTDNLKRRLQAHNDGKGAKYTQYRCPVQLIYFESYSSKSEAMQREAAIKKLSRQQKLRLCALSVRESKNDDPQ